MRIIKHIPNTLTSMNLLCGALGVIFTFKGELNIAFYLMIASAVCDFFDGFAARLLKAFSPIGKALDSLADMVSFGVLPAMMLYRRMVEGGVTNILAYIPLVIAVFSALRLAKFNIDTRQTENFLGLPTPACAMWCGSLIYAADNGVMTSVGMLHNPYFIPIASIILALLLVSEIPMISIKVKKGSEYNPVRLRFIIICTVFAVAALVLKIHWSFIPLLVFTLYIIHNLIRFILSIRICKK